MAVCTAATAFANPAILLFPSVGTTKEVTVRGRALQNSPSTGSSTFSKNLRLLTCSNWEGAKVEVRFAGRTASTLSCDDGNFEVVVPSGPTQFEVGIGLVEATVKGAKAIAVIEVIAPTAPFFVISDFDDTIAITNVIQRAALFESAFLKDGQTHPPVPGMARWYQCLRSGPSERPVFEIGRAHV